MGLLNVRMSRVSDSWACSWDSFPPVEFVSITSILHNHTHICIYMHIYIFLFTYIYIYISPSIYLFLDVNLLAIACPDA